MLGIYSVCWDEATRISGKDSDFHLRDLFRAIDSGTFPEWKLGLQIMPKEDEHKFESDLLNPTKLVLEEFVPVTIISKMRLNKNPDNFLQKLNW